MPSETVINAVVALCEAFGRTATEATVGAYDIGLRGLTDEQVKAAAGLALQRCKFMPVPAELRELAVGAGQSYEGMAERAFLVLDNAVRRHSDMVSVNFADGLINATVRVLGGWPVLHEDAMTTERFTVWFRKDFLATYIRLAKAGASPDLCKYLQGTCERENAKWEGRTLPSGQTYAIDRMQPIQNVGVDYQPALPAPPAERKRIGASQEFLRLTQTAAASRT